MRKLQYLEVKTVMEARPAACIDDCLREAMILCLEQERDVTFAHNQYTYHIVFRDVWRCYKREGEPKLAAVDESLPRMIEAHELRPGDVFVPAPEACRYVAGNIEVSAEVMRVPIVSVETVSFERPVARGGMGKTVRILQHSRVILFYRKEPNDET